MSVLLAHVLLLVSKIYVHAALEFSGQTNFRSLTKFRLQCMCVEFVCERAVRWVLVVQVQLCALRAQAEYGDHGHANNFDYKSV